MTEILVKMPVGLRSTLALATRQIMQGTTNKSVISEISCFLTQRLALGELSGDKEIRVEAVPVVPKRLDLFTQDEARNTAARPSKLSMVLAMFVTTFIFWTDQNMNLVMDVEQIH